jgi:IS30 family transposase
MSFEEKDIVLKFQRKNMIITEIGAKLGRTQSTILQEVKRNSDRSASKG